MDQKQPDSWGQGPEQSPEQSQEQSREQSLQQQVADLRARVARLEVALRDGTAPAPPREFLPPLSNFPARHPENSNHSLESRIGSQWFNRIGILAVLIGMAWFLKLAIDNHWIGPAARVIIGIVAGAALITWSERFRARGFVGFSYSLKAVGSGILYLSLWAAYSLFHLAPAPVAFAAMLAVTAFNGFMAWSQNSELLALYAIVGGYCTPLLLSNGQNHELALFSYVLVLNLATLALAVARPWSRLLAATFAATLFYFATWSVDYYSQTEFASAASFLAVYFLLFAFAPRLIRASNPVPPSEPNIATRDKFAFYVLPFANAALSFLGFYILLDSPTGDATQSLAAVLFAAFYLFLMILPARLIREIPLETSSRLKAFDLLIAISFLAFALARAIHHYWWHVSYSGNPASTHDIAIYAQFTYSAFFMLFGAALLALGIARRAPFLRWQALAVLAITIAKVFLVDMSQLTAAYRVISFLGLGILLLVISFLYQRDWLNLRRQSK